jgi:23S rRNA pseudouridine1911/1915/1917 synthase
MTTPPANTTLSVTIGQDPPARLDKALARDTPAEWDLSRSRLARLIAEGSVSRDGTALTDPKVRVQEGQTITIALPPLVEADDAPEAIPLAVVYEDADLIVIDKPPGMVVHPAPGTADGTLVNALLAHCGDSLSGVGGARRPGIVHRIDKDTSGLLVVAKSDRAHHGLAAQFERHDVDRHYIAIVHGAPDPADPRLRGLPGVAAEAGGVLRIATQIGRHPTDRQRQAVLASGGRHAVTRFRVVERFGHPPAASMIDCWLETGRTHQIRVHLTHAGHALIGDPIYGGHRKLSPRAPGAAEAAGFPRQALHAATLGFLHPVTGAAMSFASPMPPDMSDLALALRGGRGGGPGGGQDNGPR